MVLASLTLERISLALGAVRVARSAANSKPLRTLQEREREPILREGEASAQGRGRVVLHSATTDSEAGPSALPESSNSSPHSAQAPWLGSSSYGSTSVCRQTSPSSSAVGVTFFGPRGSPIIS